MLRKTSNIPKTRCITVRFKGRKGRQGTKGTAVLVIPCIYQDKHLFGFAPEFEAKMGGSKMLHLGEIGVGEK